jgi:GntR family transcriptional regulator/MocR family aminotransferase
VDLTNAVRDAIRTGRLHPGTRLPSSRSLAADLGVARNTVADSYAELVAEGWLVARQGSGTSVASRVELRKTVPTSGPALSVRQRSRFGMLPGSPDLAEFPRKQWLAAARRALNAAPYDAFGYGNALGRIELRTALADYLSRVRGVYAAPERIIICAGFHQGLTLMAQALKLRRVRAMAVESYGLDLHRDLLRHSGLHIPALPVDEHGAYTEKLPHLRGVGAVLLTPAHQYPTGFALSPERRAAAVDWAREAGGVILEDDYDGEFRYDRQPVGALQGLDPERVAYFGTASKSLAPGLRLGWMVLPEEFVGEIVKAKGYADLQSSALEQLTLAEFIASGEYDRHVRSMRLRYRRRRDQLVTTLGRRAPGIRVTGMSAGLQAVLELPPGCEQSVVQAAERQGLEVSGMTPFRYEGETGSGSLPTKDALVVNYAAPSDSAWTGALDALCAVMP